VQTAIGKAPRARLRGRARDITKSEETTATSSASIRSTARPSQNLDRIYTSIEQYPELAQVLEQRVRATQEPFQLVELYGRLGQLTRSASRSRTSRSSRSSESSTSSILRTKRQSRPWSGCSPEGRMNDLKAVLTRELEGASARRKEADIRAKLAHLSSEQLGDVPLAVETWKRVLDLRGEDPEALSALADLYERTEQWAELCDVLERHYDIAPTTRRAWRCSSAAPSSTTPRLGRSDSAARRLRPRLDIDYANLTALYAVADIWRRRNDANELVAALHQTGGSRGSAAPAGEPRALYRELGRRTRTSSRRRSTRSTRAQLLEVDPRDFEGWPRSRSAARRGSLGRGHRRQDGPRRGLRDGDGSDPRVLEVAGIWDNQVGARTRATPAYEKILAIEPTHDQAFHRRSSSSTGRSEAQRAARSSSTRAPRGRETCTRRRRSCGRSRRSSRSSSRIAPQAFDALQTPSRWTSPTSRR